MRFFLLALSLCVLAAAPVSAASVPVKISTHGGWTAYSFDEDGAQGGKPGKVCYIAATPKKAVGKYKKRGDVFALITHRPAENSKNVFSYVAGYTIKPGSEVTVSVDGRKFILFPRGETAWTPDETTDNQLVEAIRKGSTLTVKATSSRGTATTDTYSLNGTGDAYTAIGAACGL